MHSEDQDGARSQQQQRSDRDRSNSLEYRPDRLITPLTLRAPVQNVEASASDHGENDQLGAERTVRLAGNRDQDRNNKDYAEQAQRLGRPVP